MRTGYRVWQAARDAPTLGRHVRSVERGVIAETARSAAMAGRYGMALAGARAVTPGPPSGSVYKKKDNMAQKRGRSRTPKPRMTRTASLPPTPAKRARTRSLSAPPSYSMPSDGGVKMRSVSRSASAVSRTGGSGQTSGSVTTISAKKAKVAQKKKKTHLTQKYLNAGGGSTKQAEFRQSTDVQCEVMYVGSGPPMEEYLECLCRAIVGKLFQKSGVTISRWDELMCPGATAYQITFEYYPEINAALQSKELNVINNIPGTNKSYEQYALELALKIQEAVSTNDNVLTDNFRFTRFLLFACDEDGTAGSTQSRAVQAQMFVDEWKIEVKQSSSLKIQNQTNDNQGEGATISNSSNPLAGKVYHLNGNTVWRKGQHPGTDSAVMQASTGSGLFVANSTEIANKEFRKLPPASAFRSIKKSGKFVIQPGALDLFKTERYQIMNVNKFLYELRFYARSAAIRLHSTFGAMVFVALEKILDAGNEGNNPMRLGIQNDWKLSGRLSQKQKTVSRPITTIQAASSGA